MSQTIEKLQALAEIMRLEISSFKESYKLDLGEMYLIADGVKAMRKNEREEWHCPLCNGGMFRSSTSSGERVYSCEGDSRRRCVWTGDMKAFQAAKWIVTYRKKSDG